MADQPMPPAVTATDMRLDVLIALQRATNEAMRDLCARLRPEASVEPETDQIELREPSKRT